MDDRHTRSPHIDGWPYPVKPAYIRDLLALWERNKPLVQLLELASDRVAQDIRSSATRRRTLHQVAEYFVPLTGDDLRARTVSPNPWAAYSQLFSAQSLAPAYLVHISDANELAYAVAWLLHHRYRRGDAVSQRQIREHLSAAFGPRPSVRAGAATLVRTLAHFGVLAQAGGVGQYVYADGLRVDVEAFPLLVWAWWRARRVPVIRIPALVDDLLLTYLDHASYAGHWAAYDGSLWTLERRDGADCAVLRCDDEACFIRTMFNLLSGHPKWPTVARQDPEP